MDTSKLKLCVIFCAGFNSASTIQSDANLCREHLVSFCKLLANSPPKQNPEFDALLQKSFAGMDAFLVDSGMSVCNECNFQITVALEKGTEAEKKEKEVRELQLQILQQMKELQKQVDEFHEEMTKLEKTIQTSDVSCLMYHMAKNPSKNEDATNGIALIRDRILDVMADLRDFQARQNNILNVDLNALLNLHPTVISDDGENVAGEDDDYIKYIPAPDVVIGTEGLLEAAGIAPMFFGHTIFTNEGDFRYEAGAKNNGTKGDSDYSKSDDDEDSSDSDISLHSANHTNNKLKREKGKNPSAASSTTGVASSGVPTSQSSVPRSVPALHPIVVSSFKKEIINRCQRRQDCRTVDDNVNLDPLIRYPLTYSAVTDKFTICDFEVVVDESYRTLKCAACGFTRRENKRGGGSLDIEWKMKVHIMSSHIGFNCTASGCNFKCSEHHQFIRHLREGRHGNQQNNNINSLQQSSRVSSKSSPRQTAPATPPKQKQASGPSTSSSSSSSINTRSRTPRVPQGESRVSATTVRMCPVTNCERTFSKKDDFIRHLQGHRNQNKWRQEQQKMKKAAKDEEPELVILD